ncbi:MAG: hypothetical protein WC496_00675 [Phycisphaerae bacterium]
MKKWIFVFIVLFFSIVCAQTEEPNVLRDIQNSITYLKQEVESLQSTVESQKREIAYLRKLCADAGIYVIPQIQEDKKSKTTGGISKPIFGVYLGETLETLSGRLKVLPSDYVFADKDTPGQVWLLENNDPNIKSILVCVFNERVYEIDIEFTDASAKNRKIVEIQLKGDYQPVYQNTFETMIDGVNIGIELNWQENIKKDDGKLMLTYIHIPILRGIYAELEKRKSR